VLYFGDHIYGDLAEPFLKHGWRTGAIINEIEFEGKCILLDININQFRQMVVKGKLLMLHFF